MHLYSVISCKRLQAQRAILIINANNLPLLYAVLYGRLQYFIAHEDDHSDGLIGNLTRQGSVDIFAHTPFRLVRHAKLALLTLTCVNGVNA